MAVQRYSYLCKHKHYNMNWRQHFPLTCLWVSKSILAARWASEIKLFTSCFRCLLGNRLLPCISLRLTRVWQGYDVRVLTGGAKNHMLFSTHIISHLKENINGPSLRWLTEEFQEVICGFNRTSRAGAASVVVSSLSVRSREVSPKLSSPRLSEKAFKYFKLVWPLLV